MEPLLSSDSVGSILPGGVGGGGGGTVSAESTTGTAVTGSAAATAGTCASGTAAATATDTATAGSGGRAGCTRSRAAIGASTAGAAFMVVSVLVLVSGHYSVGLLMTFQAVHLVAAIVIVFGGAPVVTAAASRSLFGAATAASGHHHGHGSNAAHSDNSGNDKSNNGPTVIAVVSVLLLSVTAVVDVVATLLQILARNDTVLWSSLAEDAFTVPECIVMAAVLVMLELNPRRRGTAAAGDDATLHLVVLPAIIGVSASFILLNITGTNTWDDTSDSFGSLRYVCQTLAIMFRGGSLQVALDHWVRVVAATHWWQGLWGWPTATGAAAAIVPAQHSGMSGGGKGKAPASAALARAKALAAGLADDVTAAVYARAALFGRRAVADVVSYLVGGLTVLLLVVSRAAEGEDSDVRKVADAALVVVAVANLLAYVAWLAAVARRGQMAPRAVRTTTPRRLQALSSFIRVLAPSFCAAGWLFLVMVASAPSLSTNVLAGISAATLLLQGGVMTYVLAHAPLVVVIRSPPGWRGDDAAALAPPNADTARRVQGGMQAAASFAVTFNLCLLILSIWPSSLTCTTASATADVAFRALGAFFFAYSMGVAYNVRDLFEFMSPAEAAQRRLLLDIAALGSGDALGDLSALTALATAATAAAGGSSAGDGSAAAALALKVLPPPPSRWGSINGGTAAMGALASAALMYSPPTVPSSASVSARGAAGGGGVSPLPPPARNPSVSSSASRVMHAPAYARASLTSPQADVARLPSSAPRMVSFGPLPSSTSAAAVAAPAAAAPTATPTQQRASDALDRGWSVHAFDSSAPHGGGGGVPGGGGDGSVVHGTSFGGVRQESIDSLLGRSHFDLSGEAMEDVALGHDE